MLKKWYEKALVLLAMVCLAVTLQPAVQARPLLETQSANLQSEIIASGTCGAEDNGANLTWSLDSDGVLTISGSGRMKDYEHYKASPPWYDYSNQIKALRLPDDLTYIGSSAFRLCDKLTEVTFPEHLTEIGDRAFQLCGGLTGVVLPEELQSIGSYAFWYCWSLRQVTLPDSLTEIGSYAFCGSGLSGVTFPENLTRIGVGAFSACASLTSITFQEGLRVIGEGAFSSCPGLSGTMTFPSSVSDIGAGVFYNCTGVTAFAVSGNADYRTVDGVLFRGATLIAYPCGNQRTTYTVPDGTEIIGEEAFASTTALTSVYFPETLTAIYEDAFDVCSSLTDLYFTGDVPDIASCGLPINADRRINIYYNPDRKGWTASGLSAVYYRRIPWAPCDVTVTLSGGKSATLSAWRAWTGSIYIASYAPNGRLLSVSICEAEKQISAASAPGAAYVRLIWLDGVQPLCPAQELAMS